MKALLIFTLLVTAILTTSQTHADATTVDCSEAYGNPKKSQKCEIVACNEKQKTYLGTWTGPFHAYSQELSSAEKNVYRPYDNQITYSEKDCLKNVESDDTFIIGRKTDTYPAYQNLPAKISKGLLIQGRRGGYPFLRTIDENGVNEYNLIYTNRTANTTAWSLAIEGTNGNPDMFFTIIDAQDFSELTKHKRNVTVTMIVGPLSKPFWEGVVVAGHHTLTP